jgi:cytochrome c5
MPTTYYRRKHSRARTVLLVLGAMLAVFILIQLVPYGRAQANPTASAPFRWSSPRAKAIAQRACYDCHSNQTKRWWGVKIAPFSWLAQHDIDDGRARLDFSDWNGVLSAQELRRVLDAGMPPLQYTLLHPEARLSAAEKKQLVAGFGQSLAAQQNGSAPAAGAAAAPTATPPPAASTSGADPTAIIDARCGSCHSSGPAQQFRAASAAEAQGLIEQMIQQGATVTPTEEQALVTYYTR